MATVADAHLIGSNAPPGAGQIPTDLLGPLPPWGSFGRHARADGKMWRHMLWLPDEKSCDRCGLAYEAKRAAARYCSPRCRKYASRDRVRSPTLTVTENLFPAMAIDPGAAFDVKAILRSIASDTRQPGATRVQACRAYVAISDPQSPQEKALSALNARTLEILARGSVH